MRETPDTENPARLACSQIKPSRQKTTWSVIASISVFYLINADCILKREGDVKAKNRFTTNAKIAQAINNQKTQWWSTISINQDKSGLSLRCFEKSKVTAKPLAATTPPNIGENSRTERCSALSINFVKCSSKTSELKIST